MAAVEPFFTGGNILRPELEFKERCLKEGRGVGTNKGGEAGSESRRGVSGGGRYSSWSR